MCNGLLAVIVGCLLTIANQLDVLLTPTIHLSPGNQNLFQFLDTLRRFSTSALMNRK